MIFNFDLGDLIGLPTAPAANGAIATAADDSAPSLKQELAAIILGVSTDAITPIISMASILAVIKQIDSGLIDESLNEALELMEVNLGITMGREDGFTFDFTGNLIPIMIDYEEDANGVKKDSICVSITIKTAINFLRTTQTERKSSIRILLIKNNTNIRDIIILIKTATTADSTCCLKRVQMTIRLR